MKFIIHLWVPAYDPPIGSLRTRPERSGQVDKTVPWSLRGPRQGRVVQGHDQQRSAKSSPGSPAIGNPATTARVPQVPDPITAPQSGSYQSPPCAPPQPASTMVCVEPRWGHL